MAVLNRNATTVIALVPCAQYHSIVAYLPTRWLKSGEDDELDDGGVAGIMNI